MQGRKKSKNLDKKHSSLDGIILRSSGLRSTTSRSYQPTNVQANTILDDQSKRPDGFTPQTSSYSDLSLGNELSSLEDLDAPIMLENEKLSQPKEKHTKSIKGLPSKGRYKRMFKKGSLLLLALVLIGGIFLGGKFYITQKHLFRGGGRAPALDSKIDINKLMGEGDGRVNILLLGIGGPGHDGADLTDTIMIASLDPVNNTVALLSIPRDLWVRIPGYGSQKINVAFTYGKEASKSKNLVDQQKEGLTLVDKTLESILGIPIHYHALVNFKAFQQVVEAVGGVDANVPKELAGYEVFWIEGTNKHYTLDVKSGQQHFDGMKALYFSRQRHDSSDFVRSQRQRLMLVAIKDKTFSLGTFSNPVKMSQLLSSFGDNIYTDFSLNDIMRLYQIFSKIPSSSISSLDLVTPPHVLLSTGSVGGLSVVQPIAGLNNYSDIQNYIRNALRDGFLAKENSAVAVYNATDAAGLATTKANLLKSFGYNVTTIDSLPKPTNQTTTEIIDLSNGVDKYTKHYLEQRFDVSAKTNLSSSYGITPPQGTKFVIILGKDAAKTSM